MRHVVLVGLMGSGKTTVGQLVAAGLGWQLRDSDAEIEAREGRTVREIRDARGTAALHAIEAGQLLDALAGPDRAVICAAASTVDDERCRAALRDPSLLVVWLTATPASAAARFDNQGHRPRYGDDPAAFLARQAAERDALFRGLDAVELATDRGTPAEIAALVLARLPARD
jgi:shikimate kinase